MAFLLALMAGGIRIAMGMARLGNLLNFVSHSVILGFTAGAGVLIAFNQLPSFLGLHLEKSSIFVQSLLRTISHLHETHIITFILGITTTVIILVVKRLRPSWPGTLIALVTVGAIVAIFKLGGRGVAVVGSIPRTLPPVHLPGVSPGVEIGNLAPGALAIALLGLMEAVSSAKAIAGRTHQQLNINQEFIGQGLANVAASLFSGYPVSGSFTRSALNFRTGGKTPMSGVFSGIAVAVVLLIAAPLAAVLPVAALAGVLVVVAYEMVDKEGIMRAMRATRADGSVLLVTFLSTLFLQVEFAIYVGVLLSIGLHLAKTAHPRIYSNVPDLQTGKMVVVRIEGSIFFGSATFVLEDLRRRLKNHPRMANLLIRMHDVNILDASGVHALEIVLDEVGERGGGLYFSDVNPRVLQVFKNSSLLGQVGEGRVRTSTGTGR
jgi:SulP family sulfate permease